MSENLTMDDFAQELEDSFRKIKEGDSLTGTVIDVDDEKILLDLKYYTDGIILKEDYSDNPSFSLKSEVEIGSELTATVISRDDGAGHIALSRKAAYAIEAWDKLKEYQKSGEVLTVKVEEAVKAGVIAYVEGIRGFIPASKLSLDYVDDCTDWVGKTISVQVINVDENDNKLVLSARELLRAAAAEEQKKKIATVQIGLVTEGIVESLQPYGAFVKLNDGLSGLVHISQISEKRIKHPSVVLKVGDKVKVKVTDIKDGKLSLSMKALSDATAEEITEEVYEMPETEAATTSLGSLFANLKL